ncbi:hemagglutinin/amebocyte aggregation factor-like [Engystomops pustulosus]|uniref:hemagglutinin/amebocyte aggregation factor-like n=1 Tax=Engystomops pustulosus TaxID=76066 RepID=UPI003AFB5BD5
MDILLTILYMSLLIGGVEMIFGTDGVEIFYETAREAKCVEPLKWQTCYTDPFTIVCPSQETIDSINSTHSDRYEDRVWAFSCKRNLPKSGQCYWTPYVNDYDGLLNYNCPLGEALSGLQSEYKTYYQDRRWKFYCCETNVQYIVGCQETVYVNGFDSEMNFKVPDGYVLVGAFSELNNYFEDRKWKFRYCKSQ